MCIFSLQIVCDLNENALSVNSVTPEPRVRTRTRNLIASPPSPDASPILPLRRVIRRQQDPDVFASPLERDNTDLRISAPEGNNDFVNFDHQLEKNVHKPGVEKQLHKVNNSSRTDINTTLAVQDKAVIEEGKPNVKPRRSHPLFPRKASEGENSVEETSTYLNEMRASLNATRPLLGSRKENNLPIHRVG